MAKQVSKLTKRTVDALTPNGKDAVYWDSELTGFGVRVRKSGRKHYVVQTRLNGRLGRGTRSALTLRLGQSIGADQ